MPIVWQSKHIRKVINSTLPAETLAMVDMSEVCLFHRKLLLELLQLKDKTENIKKLRILKSYVKWTIPVFMTQLYSMTQILDKTLR